MPILTWILSIFFWGFHSHFYAGFIKRLGKEERRYFVNLVKFLNSWQNYIWFVTFEIHKFVLGQEPSLQNLHHHINEFLVCLRLKMLRFSGVCLVCCTAYRSSRFRQIEICKLPKRGLLGSLGSLRTKHTKTFPWRWFWERTMANNGGQRIEVRIAWSNPIGLQTHLSASRLARLVRLAKEWALILVEDPRVGRSICGRDLEGPFHLGPLLLS